MLHSVWLGGAEKTDLLKTCESTWPSVRKEWTRWPAKLQPMKYYLEAIENKHWAAAGDLLRLQVLHEYGGVYVDCDAEIMRPDLLAAAELFAFDHDKVVIGKEDLVNVCGAVIIAPPRHSFITRMLDVYAGLKFSDTFGDTNINGTTLLTREATARNDVQIEHAPTFHPIHWSVIEQLSMDERRAVAREFNSVTLHHFAKQWSHA